MSEHPNELRAWTEAYRRVRRPSPAARARIETALRDGERRRAPARARIAVTGFAAMAAAVIMVWLLARVWPTTRVDRAAPLRDHAELVSEPAQERASHPSPGRASRSDAPARLPPGLDQSSTTVPADSPRTSESSPVRPRGQSPVESVSREGLDSLALLRRAEDIIATRPEDALALLRQHRERYPGSSLAIERQALEAMAGCGVDRSAAAATAEAFLRAHRSSAYAARVRRACVDAPPEKN